MSRLSDKVALVTGAGRGIGQAMALRLAQEGADVVAADIDGQLAEETASKAAEHGGRTLGLQVDVTRQSEIDRMVQLSVEAMGRLDILMNNAGVLRFQEMLNITENDWDFVCNVNLKGTFFVMQAVARHMIHQGSGGKIINTASTSGKQPDPLFLPYAVSKAGIICMTKGAALALGSHHINVNAVCPGPTITEMHMTVTRALAARDKISVEEMIQRRESASATGRRNRPEDVAALAAFLASADAANITGQAFNVDGGVVMA